MLNLLPANRLSFYSMGDIISKLDDFERKLRSHIKAQSELQNASGNAKARVLEMDAELSRKKERISELEEELKVAKTAGAIQKNGAEVAEAKGRINEMVREIDKCIALLNS